MSAQSDAEQAIRELYQLLSRGEEIKDRPDLIAVDKRNMSEKLARLSTCISELLTAYELTALGKEKARREQERDMQQRERQTKKRAEQVYAASILYSDKALSRTDRLIENQKEQLEVIFRRFLDELQSQQTSLRRDKLELGSELQNMEDTEVYLQAIEEVEKRLKSDAEEEDFPKVAYEKPEIKVNEAYIPKVVQVEAPELPPLPGEEVGTDLDLEYFKWTEEQGDEN